MMRARLVAAVAMVSFVGCGGGSGTDPSENPPPDSSNTITISSAGVVSPKELEIPVGSRVTILNNDRREHDMSSDPHPDHGDCPEINQIGFLVPGQSRQSGNFTEPQSCGYHDHISPEDARLHGRITVR